MCGNTFATENVQNPAFCLSGVGPDFISWWHRGLGSWLDCFQLCVRLVNAHHICIHWLTTWWGYLIMMRLLIEAWLRGGVWQLVMSLTPSLPPSQHCSFSTDTHRPYSSPHTHICCSDSALWGSLNPPPQYFNQNFIFCLNTCLLADTPGLKRLHVNGVPRADFSSVKRHVEGAGFGVEAWQTGAETTDRSQIQAGCKSRGGVTDSVWRRQLCRQM